MRLRVWAMLLLYPLFVCGCGRKGPLYLPHPAPTKPATHVAGKPS